MEHREFKMATGSKQVAEIRDDSVGAAFSRDLNFDFNDFNGFDDNDKQNEK